MTQEVAEIKTNWKYLGHEVHSLCRKPSKVVQAEFESPALLLIHGFGASTDHWRYNIPFLSRTHEVHALDLLGFGRSSKPSNLDYGGDLWRQQVVAYIKEIIQKPTVVVGNSLGGYAALAAASSLGNEAAGVVLLNAAGYFSDERKKSNNLISKIRQFVGGGLLKDPLVQRLIFENLRQPSTIRRTLKQVYIDQTNVDDYLVEAIRKPSLDQGAFKVFKSVFDSRGPQGKPLDELFAGLKVPVLLVWGERDPWMNAKGKRASFLRHAPSGTKEVVLDAGHCPHDEVPDKVNEALLDWLIHQ